MIYPPHVLAFSAFVVLGAGIVRGYSGFGFSMIVVICLSMVLEPTEVVPVIFLLEVVASSWLIPKIWNEIDWQSLKWLFPGIALGTPIGVYLLASIPGRPMRIAIAIFVIILVGLLYKGFSLRKMPGKKMTLLSGFTSGLINGGASIGGPLIVLFYFSSPAGIATSRASLIVFFLGTDLLASFLCIAQGLITLKTLLFMGILLIPMIIGINVGNRRFSFANPESFRKKVMLLLLIMAVAILIKTTIV